VKAVPTFGLHADTFFTQIIVTAHPYFLCRINFSVTCLETSFKNMERSKHAMICGHGTAVFGQNQKFLVNFCNF